MQNVEGKIIGYLTALVVIIGAAAWASNYSAVADIRSRLSDEKASLRGLGTSIEAMQRQSSGLRKKLADTKAQLQAAALLIDQPAELTLQLGQFKKQAAEHTSEAISLAQEFEKTVLAVRNAALGTTIPELVLSSGKVLTNAQIKRVSEDTVVVLHSVGTARLHRADLTKDWAERFQLVEPQAVAQNAAPFVTNAPRGPSDQTKIADLRNKIAQLRAQALIAAGNAHVWTNTAWQLQTKFSDAEAKGRIVTNKNKIDEAHKTAASCTQKAYSLEAEARVLENQLYNLNSGG